MPRINEEDSRHLCNFIIINITITIIIIIIIIIIGLTGASLVGECIVS